MAYSQQDPHRDVRVALIQSLDTICAAAQAWEMLEENTRNPDPVIAQASARSCQHSTASSCRSWIRAAAMCTELGHVLSCVANPLLLIDPDGVEARDSLPQLFCAI